MNQSTASHFVWADLATADPAGSRAFYSDLFGWIAEPDEAFGGYAIGRLEGKDVAGIGPTQMPGQPTAWSVYLGTADADGLVAQVTAAGGTVIVPPFPVGPMGRMVVFQDPIGAFISAWEPALMPGFTASGPGAVAWTELNARGLESGLGFYTSVFGWTARQSPVAESGYVEFMDGDVSLAGAMEMPPMVPAEVPSYWQIYFGVTDIDATHAAAIDLGAHEIHPPTDFGGGRFSILSDPQMAPFGLLQMG